MLTATRLSPDEIRQGMKKFSTWNYEWDFGNGIKAIPDDTPELPSQTLRLRRIFDALSKEFGGGDQPLKGLSVLDIGCNEGLFAVEAKRLGAARVVGIEPRQDKVDQANFIAQALGIEGIEYRTQSFWDLTKDMGTYDIVLFVGVLHHVDRSLECLKILRPITEKVMVIDTQLLYFNYPIIAFKEEGTDIHTNAFDTSLVSIPTEKALRLMATYAGFDMVKVPLPKNTWSQWKKSKIGKRYINHSHGSFLCFPREGDPVKRTITRTSHENLHVGIYRSMFRGETILASMGLGFKMFLQKAPQKIYKNKHVAAFADKAGLTPKIKKIYNRVLYKKK